MAFERKDEVSSGVKIKKAETDTLDDMVASEDIEPVVEEQKSEEPRVRPSSKPKSLGSKPPMKRPKPEESYEDDYVDDDEGNIVAKLLGNKKLLIGVGGIIALALVVSVTTSLGGKGETPVVVLTDTPPIVEEELQQDPVDPLKQELADQGIGLNTNKDTSTNSTALSSNTFLKDLTGVDVPEYYTVKDITYITDLVPYTKHRAVTGDGIELYWIEGTYRGQPCKFTIPYKYFRELDNTGAIPCMIEIVQTDTGALIATWFQFSEPAYTELKNK